MSPAARLLCGLALAATLALAGCQAPADEAWLRIVGFQKADSTTAITALEASLTDEKTDYVSIVLRNGTTTAGTTGSSGAGIAVYRAIVDYTLGSYTLPSFTYDLTVYLPAVAGEGTADVTVQDFPLVPASLKLWILTPGSLPIDVSGRFQVQARITLQARTDEGRELETRGGLSILF